jgi:putative PIN family toxin of toxin-antitoxin system
VPPEGVAVVDPNVVISALIKPASAPGEVLRAIDTGLVVPVVSPILLAELDRVASRPKFRRWFSLSAAWAARGLLEQRGVWYADPAPSGALTRDRADDYLVRLANVSEADCIVSGDKDLLDAADDLGVPVRSPRDLLDWL